MKIPLYLTFIRPESKKLTSVNSRPPPMKESNRSLRGCTTDRGRRNVTYLVISAMKFAPPRGASALFNSASVEALGNFNGGAGIADVRLIQKFLAYGESWQL